MADSGLRGDAGGRQEIKEVTGADALACLLRTGMPTRMRSGRPLPSSPNPRIRAGDCAG